MFINKLAKKAYEAHLKTVDGKNYRGEEIPKWKDLPADIKAAWRTAVAAVQLFL